MNLNGIKKGINYPISILGILFALTSSEIQAGTMGPIEACEPGGIYLGVFGGAARSNRIDISQYGTAFYLEAAGGPLAVNAFGTTDHHTEGFIGAHVGYQWPELLSTPFSLSLSPAAELEGYYIGKRNFTGHDINNDTTRLPEHDFLVTYPIKTGVFLTNAVLSINPSSWDRWHPYVGMGIGGAVASISNAAALQVAPPEAGVNHYNANTDDKEATFAAQAKVGLNFDLTENASLFAEYRWLYLANTNYFFGSTVYPGHPATSNWLVRFGPQRYNMGAIGIQYSIG